MAHTCHAEGCTRAVPPKLLMCAPHWRSVPSPWKAQVWATYRKGQEVDKKPSAEYLLVQGIVVAIVAVKDRVWTKVQAEDHIHKRAQLVWERLQRDWVQRLPQIDLGV